MVEMTPQERRRVGEAIVVWSGWARDSYPLRKENSLVERFGSEAAAKFMRVIRELEEDFYSSDSRYTAVDVAEMASVSAEKFRKKYPDLPEDAVRALAWCYTFDYK